MQFQLNDTPAKLTSVTNRVERHGDDEVPAISVGLRITTSNTILDKLSPTLRNALYTIVEGQPQLPGVEEATPILRTRHIETAVIAATFEGWTLRIDHGIDDESAIECGGCKIDKFRVEPHEGGSVELSFRVGTSDVEPEEAGLLWSKNGQEVSVTLTPPPPAKPVIDGTTGAFEKDHPKAGDATATDLFVAGAPA